MFKDPSKLYIVKNEVTPVDIKESFLLYTTYCASMASGGNRHPDADRRESTERQEAIRTMFVNPHATEQTQS